MTKIAFFFKNYLLCLYYISDLVFHNYEKYSLSPEEITREAREFSFSPEISETSSLKPNEPESIIVKWAEENTAKIPGLGYLLELENRGKNNDALMR